MQHPVCHGGLTATLAWLNPPLPVLAASSLGKRCCGGKCKLPCRDALEKLRRQLPITASRLAARQKAQAADSQLEAEQVGSSPVTVLVSVQRAGSHLSYTKLALSCTACAVHSMHRPHA